MADVFPLGASWAFEELIKHIVVLHLIPSFVERIPPQLSQLRVLEIHRCRSLKSISQCRTWLPSSAARLLPPRRILRVGSLPGRRGR